MIGVINDKSQKNLYIEHGLNSLKFIVSPKISRYSF